LFLPTPCDYNSGPDAKETYMAALPVTPAIPSPEPAPPSEGARIINTFIAPSKTFTDLRRNPSWWAPWLMISIFSVAFMLVVGRQIGFDQVSRNQIAHSARADQFDKLPPDQQAQQLRISAAVTRYVGYALPAVTLLYFLVVAAVLMGTFKIAGANVSFGTSVAIVAYASLPGILHSTLAIISMFAGVDRENFDINNPVATNPAYFMDPMGNKFLRTMASGLDVFMIWSLVLMGIGFASNSKVKRSTAIGIVLGWYLAWKLATGALAAAF
jgi:hypothetical protein